MTGLEIYKNRAIVTRHKANNHGAGRGIDMKLDEIKEIAKRHNIKAGKMKKADLVRAIQLAEGNKVCFDTGQAETCGQQACLWREDCA